MFLKEQLMYSYTFKHIGNLSEIDFSNSVIWVLHADKIPPHIGFSSENIFYSLKVSGKDEQLNVQHVLDLIHRKKIPSLFIQLKTVVPLTEVKHTYNQYERAVYGSVTCLTPIREFVHQPDARQLSDLLNGIDHTIETTAGVNLPENYTSLPVYSIDEIYSYISELSKNH